MDLFEKYETLKKSNELIPIGSVWTSACFKWKVQSVNNGLIWIRLIRTVDYPHAQPEGLTLSYSKERFKQIFKRVK